MSRRIKYLLSLSIIGLVIASAALFVDYKDAIRPILIKRTVQVANMVLTAPLLRLLGLTSDEKAGPVPLEEPNSSK